METDHANLRWLMSANHQTGRLARWILMLQEFDFIIRHKPGKANMNADALSRLPSNGTASQSSVDAPLMAVTRDIVDLPTLDDIRSQHESDPLLHAIIDFLKHSEHRIASTELKEVLCDTGYITVDSGIGLLMHTSTANGRRHYVLILLPSGRLAVIKVLHDLPMSGHLGYKKRIIAFVLCIIGKALVKTSKPSFGHVCHAGCVNRRHHVILVNSSYSALLNLLK